ncbi:hypothetical protein HNR23_002267 [Nocardiopsis mwathae]|uniref:Uncharacterized protein n=1 Tax=Nocardiopsis mwathae TaxID=1472723 RepID=A0A7W9YHG9_9ACTN|nr:hypothetical protein [Nocardiopsis mwathae]MBB6172207.1 hypothetical protein [Nocardiopsis mwathae]
MGFDSTPENAVRYASCVGQGCAMYIARDAATRLGIYLPGMEDAMCGIENDTLEGIYARLAARRSVGIGESGDELVIEALALHIRMQNAALAYLRSGDVFAGANACLLFRELLAIAENLRDSRHTK